MCLLAIISVHLFIKLSVYIGESMSIYPSLEKLHPLCRNKQWRFGPTLNFSNEMKETEVCLDLRDRVTGIEDTADQNSSKVHVV